MGQMKSLGWQLVERNEISAQEVRVYSHLKRNGARWTTSKTTAAEAHVAPRTARALLLKFVRLNIVDQAEVFPAHRYRLSEKAARRNLGYVQRLEHACAVFADSVGGGT